jgi:hypothetical protein
MKVLIFKGGIGNQMFQYVFYNWLRSKCKHKIYGFYGKKYLKEHNGLELDKVFTNIDIPKSSFLPNITVFVYKIRKKLLRNKVTKDFQDECIINIMDRVIYDGYWQNLDFLTNNTYKLFAFNKELILKDKRNVDLLELIVHRQSVSIHIRRGDYQLHPDIYGNVCTSNYYKSALAKFDNIKSKLLVFFSDDIEWVRREYCDRKYAVFVNWNLKEYAFIDMYLMSKCKHNIIANSTFSWWGAYLNPNPDKIVIAPQKWFNSTLPEPNIFPKEWIRI